MKDFEPVSLPLGHRRPPLPGEVEIWVCRLADFPLGPAIEPEQPGSYRQAMRFRQRFVLRLLLGSYLNCPGKSVCFEQGPAGKPRLVSSTANEKPLDFNMSHSGDWMAVAVASDLALGIDIEVGRVLKRASALAQRSFSAAEADWIRDLPEPEQSAAFFRLWTRREALVKAMGASLFATLKELELDPGTGQPRRLPASWPAPANWRVEQLELPNTLTISLAAPRSELSLRGFALDCSASGVAQ
jgi:phosphopantetheinyl transferase